MDVENVPEAKIAEPDPLSFLQRLTNEDWSVRQLALQEVINGAKLDEETRENLIQDYDSAFSESNPENQQLVLQMYTKLLGSSDFQVTFDKRAFWYNFVDKFLASGKAAIKESAEAFKELIVQRCTTLLDNCCYLLSKNNAKISKEILKILLNESSGFDFTAKVADLAPALDKNLLSANAEVRSQTFNLIQKLIQNSLPNLAAQLKNLKKPQLEELGKLKPAEPAKKVSGGAFKKRNDSTISAEQYKTAAATNILGIFTESWCEKVLAAPKWSEKKQMVDAFIKAADVQKLASGDYSHLVRLGKILVNDPNIQVQICGLKTISMLSRGLRHTFRACLRPNMDILIHKLKDRKNTVIEALLDVFQSVFLCLSVEELFDELKAFNTKRNKDVRVVITKIVKNYFDFILESENLRNLEVFISLFSKVINCYYDDPDIEIRTLVNELVLHIQEQLEQRDELYAFNKSIDLKKVKKPQAKSMDKIQGSGHKTKNSLTPPKKMKDKPLLEIAPLDLEKNPLEVALYSFKDIEISLEAVDAKVKELFGSDVIQRFREPAWKVKAEALAQFLVMVSNSTIRLDSYFTFCIGKMLETELKDFSESNMMIIKETVQLMIALISCCENAETLFFYVAKLVAKKAGEPKLHLSNLFAPLADKLPYHIIFSLMTRFAVENKNPKALAEVNEILLGSLKKNATFIFKDLKEYFKAILNHNNPQVRTSGLNLLKSYSASFPEKIDAIVALVENQSFANSIKDELVQHKPKVPEPRNSIGIAEITAKLNSGDWKCRLSAVDEFAQYIESHSDVKVADTFPSFQARFRDSQKGVAMSAIMNFRRLLERNFDAFKAHHKQLIADMIVLVHDKVVS